MILFSKYFVAGIALSMGQVYAIKNIYASTLMNVAVFLYSPLLFATCTIGAITGSLAGKYCIVLYTTIY